MKKNVVKKRSNNKTAIKKLSATVISDSINNHDASNDSDKDVAMPLQTSGASPQATATATSEDKPTNGTCILINHSYHANCSLIEDDYGKFDLIASREIQIGEKITLTSPSANKPVQPN